MTDLVPSSNIEAIVGAPRHESLHLGHAVSAEARLYIMHSKECKAAGADLRDCEYSKAVDRGLDINIWASFMDRPMALEVFDGLILPMDLEGVTRERS